MTQQDYGGYRANLVAYSNAKLPHATAQRLDLAAIWERQAPDDEVEAALTELSRIAWKELVEGAGANITEWAKREQCWKAMRSEPWAVPSELTARS